MKRTERHHLKENEVAIQVGKLVALYEARRREFNLAAYVVVAVLLLSGGYYYWQQRTRSQAADLLAQATMVLNAPVVPPAAPAADGKPAPPPPPGSYPSDQARYEAALPKLTAAADRYPSTEAGISARYQEGTALLALGRPADAVAAFQQVMQQAGSGVFTQMARLGLAEAHAQQGHYDEAIATFKALTLQPDGQLPIDGILMQLGRTYVAAGKTAEAVQAFKRIVQEFPDSPYSPEAQQQIDQLEGHNG
ncbi:MAG: tetratricopeptide repeat protein [Acidobacteriota bacterium]|nr:tetratricopeptide repeat protein [Acidobacteriota bacterium]